MFQVKNGNSRRSMCKIYSKFRVYLEPSQIFYFLAFFKFSQKSSIIDVQLGSKYTSEVELKIKTPEQHDSCCSAGGAFIVEFEHI